MELCAYCNGMLFFDDGIRVGETRFCGEICAWLSSIPPCSLSDYRGAVSGLPRPTAEQIESFARFVSEAHSWYKHLPLLRPGVTFRFFVDPLSGHDCILRPDGELHHEERTEDGVPFHYTWMTTKEYRSRFGHLSYDSDGGPRLPIFSTIAGEVYRIPPEVARVGAAELTGVVHPLAAQPFVWNWFLPKEIAMGKDKGPRWWPAETGGKETLQKIVHLCQGRREPSGADLIDPELVSLLRPERERLLGSIVGAINRALDLLDACPGSHGT